MCILGLNWLSIRENGHRKRIFFRTFCRVEIFKTPFSALPEDGRSFLKTNTSRCWMPINAHPPIKDDTVFSLYCVFVWTGTSDSKMQRDYFENGEKNLRF